MSLHYETRDGEETEILSESVCFRVDPLFESVHALPILSALQSYVRDIQSKTLSWNCLHREKKKHELTLTLICPRKEMKDFIGWWMAKEETHSFAILESPEGLHLNDFDYYVDITAEKVYDIIRAGRLHLHQGVGIMIGCASGSLADISEASSTVQAGSLLIVGADYLISLELAAHMKTKFSSVCHISSDADDVTNAADILELIRKAEAVMGWRGFSVYSASCLKKPVLELNCVSDDFWFSTQWSNPFYATLELGDQVDHNVLKRGVDQLWEMVLLSRGFATRTDQEMYTAAAVSDL